MAPPRRRASLLKRNSTRTILVSYKDAIPGPSTQKLVDTQARIVSQFRQQGHRNDKGTMTVMSTPPPPVLERMDIIKPGPSKASLIQVPQPTVSPQDNPRRSARVPKRKRLSTSPEEVRQPPGKVNGIVTNSATTSTFGENYSHEKIPWTSQAHSPPDPLKTPVKGVLMKPENVRNGNMIDEANIAEDIIEKMTSTPTMVGPITPDYFKGNENFGAALMLLIEPDPTINYNTISDKTSGWIQCGVCCDVSEINLMTSKHSNSKRNGAFLCGKCITFFNKLLKVAKSALAFVCLAQDGTGGCPQTSSCEACFIHNCLLLFDLTDDIYFKLWRAVPPAALANVPPIPPKVKRYSETRGKILWVNKCDGSILHVSDAIAGGGKGKKVERRKGADPIVAKTVYDAKTGASKKGGELAVVVTDVIGGATVNTGRGRRYSRRYLEETEVKPIDTETLKTEQPNVQPNITVKSDEDDNDKKEIGATNITRNENEDNSNLVKDENKTEPQDPDKNIRVFSNATSDLEEHVIEQHGRSVVVVAGNEPPTPLCFNCGSAGINQLVYCSSCGQPFHPYCSEDELLLTAYLAEISLPSQQSNALEHKFRKWKCSRCLTCSHCGHGREAEDNFVGCSLCASSYHLRCAKRMPLKPVEKNIQATWVCAKCLHCTSCQIPLTKNSHHLRKLGADGIVNQPEILCFECFKRRRNGSFCPVCFVCYDDNDWDSKMMECDKCKRWIHAQCEKLNDERYFILSALPDAIAYVCRLCQPPIYSVGWRYAVESEVVEGCLRVLELFHKKVVGVSRKRRALSFDMEDGQGRGITDGGGKYFSPSVVVLSSTAEPALPLQEKNVCSISSSEIDISMNLKREQQNGPAILIALPQLSPVENDLIKRYNIRPCIIRIVDMDIMNRRRLHIPTATNNFLLNESVIKTEKIPPLHPGEVTPTKPKDLSSPPPLSLSHSICTTTPQKLSTPHRVATSFTDAVKASSSLWKSGVRTFRSIALALLPSYIMEITESGKYEDFGSETKFIAHFDDTLKQVFPWWRDDLKELPERDINDNIYNEDIASENGDDDLFPMVVDKSPEELPDASILKQCYWDEKHFYDKRVCSLCGERGDYPLNSCGRLLYVSPEEWVHVNCTIWSSEVWEEETGALQQVEVALIRGKRSMCDHCAMMGATLNCCAASCRNCYHFMCAKEAGCFLLTDKSVFCSGHSVHAKGQVQTDMHVTRKVFVSGVIPPGSSSARRKELMLPSNRLKLFVGSNRVDRLGRIVPISVVNLAKKEDTSLLQPVNFRVAFLRLLKTHGRTDEKKYAVIEWRTALNTFGDFRELQDTTPIQRCSILPLPTTYSVVIDHTKRPDVVGLRLKEAQAFWNWEKSVDKFVDEFGIEWTPTYVKPKLRNKKKSGSSRNSTSVNKLSHQIHRASLDWYPPPINPYEEELLKQTLSNPRLRFLIEQLPGVEDIGSCYNFRHCDPSRLPEDIPASPTPSGCSRSEPFSTRRSYDMFNWLRSKHRKPPNFSGGLSLSEETTKSKGLPLAMRFRNLRERASKDLVVLPSHIHGRGLFARRDMGVGEMLIEYAGETIRSVLCDVRERKYELAGIGCYMFRVNRDLVVDATMKGNAARFINHSCEPNCESKAVKILGKDHILIFALTSIGRGEELTYDYKFERETDKLPCSCGTRKCRRFLN